VDDKRGLDLAYAQSDSLYFDTVSSTLYVAGTHSVSDVMIDLFKLPEGQLRTTERYKLAKEAFDRIKPSGLVGHSLGASIISMIAEDEPHARTVFRAYSRPAFTWTESDPRVTSSRYYGDPISMGDRAATSSLHLGNPHAY